MKKTAMVIGGSGLVGSHLVEQLLVKDEYETIKVFGRRSVFSSTPKVKEIIVDFDHPESFSDKLQGDVLFSSMGTTIRTAGSKDAQYKVDFTYQYEVARAAAKNGVTHYVLVSSAGANPESRFFYMKMKGELEEEVKKLGFKHITIIRPATLKGDRNETRAGEKAAIVVTGFLAGLIPGIKKYRPIHASTVAEAMINAVTKKDASRFCIYSYEEVFTLAGH